MTERIANWIKIAAFVLVISAPVAALLFFGSVPPVGQRSHPSFPTLRAILNGKAGAFDQFGQATLDRSAVTREAISLKYGLSYGVWRYVDTDKVISGRDDWLFYKDEFSKNIVCIDEARMARNLAQVDAMTDIADAAGIRMIVSISPDKSTIYPEYLHPLARRYWACKGESTSTLRKLLATHAPRIVDHAVPLIAEKTRDESTKLFWHQDTHWTPLGAAFAVRQLFEVVAGRPEAAVPPPRMSGAPLPRETDMGNRMLLLRNHEVADEVDPGVEMEMLRVFSARPVTRAVVLADSFYDAANFTDASVFPGVRRFHIDRSEPALHAALSDAQVLVVNSVERSLMGRIESGALSWGSAVGQALMARNAKAAEACADFHGADMTPGDARVMVGVPSGGEGGLPCVRINLAALKTEVVVELPARGDEVAGRFAEGRNVHVQQGAGAVITLVLPEYTRGKTLGLRGDGRNLAFAPGTVEIGSAPRF